MHCFLLFILLILAIKKANWDNWRVYYPTMLYISLGSFVYEFISHSKFHLWELEEFGLLTHMNIHFIHNLIINPLIAFIFLSCYPEVPIKRCLYILRWVLIFLFVEWGGTRTGILSYHHGWNLGWSLLFILIMFPMIRLHFIYPLRAIALSVLFAVFFLTVFDYV